MHTFPKKDHLQIYGIQKEVELKFQLQYMGIVLRGPTPFENMIFYL